MGSLVLELVAAAGVLFSLSFGSPLLQEQQLLTDDFMHEESSSKEPLGVGFDLTASYG